MKYRLPSWGARRLAIVAAPAVIFFFLGYLLGRRQFETGVTDIGEIGRWSNPRFFPRSPGEFPPHERARAALEAAQERLEKNPYDLNALLASGIAFVALGKDHAGDAINRLESARELGAADSRIFFYLGSLYKTAGLRPYAIEEYDRFLRNHPDDLGVLDESARLKFELGRHAESAQTYARIIERNPRRPDPQAVENLALSYFQLKEWEKALALLRDLAKAAPQRAQENSFFVAESLKQLDRCPEAIEAYETALAASLDRGREKVVQEGKLACLQSGAPKDLGLVEQTARRLLELDAGNPAARSALRALSKKKKHSSHDSKS